MAKKGFWQIFVVVFVVTFLVNAGASYLLDQRSDRDSKLRWDTTSATAVIAGLVVSGYLSRRKREQ